MPTPRRSTLTTIKAATSSVGRKRAHHAGGRDCATRSLRERRRQKPSWLRTRMSHSSTRADEQRRRPCASEARGLREIASAESPTSASARAASRSAPAVRGQERADHDTSSAAPARQMRRSEAPRPRRRQERGDGAGSEVTAFMTLSALPRAVSFSARARPRTTSRNTSSSVVAADRPRSAPKAYRPR